MSAEINSQDFQSGTSQAWHGKTIVKTAEEMLLAGFSYELEKQQIARLVGGNWQPIPEQYVIGSSDNSLPIGCEGIGDLRSAQPQADSFGFMRNSEFWAMVQRTIEGTGFRIESYGTLQNRRKRFVSLKPGKNSGFAVNSREFLNYLNLLDALDGTNNLTCLYNNVCVVCANTYSASMSAGGKKAQNRHSKNHLERVPEFEAKIEAFFGFALQFERLMGQLEEIPLDAGKAQNIYAGFLGKGEEMSTRTSNQIRRLTSLFETGRGNRGKTGLDLFSGVTEYYTRESVLGGRRGWAGQITSSETPGESGFRMKEEFLSSLVGFAPSGQFIDKRKLTALIDTGKASFDKS